MGNKFLKLNWIGQLPITVTKLTITMHQEKYSLSWQAYSDHLREMMQEIMNDDFADVTLISEDKKQIKAHKNIVSAEHTFLYISY